MKYDVIIKTIKTGAEVKVDEVVADNQITARKLIVSKWWCSPMFNAITQQLSVVPSRRKEVVA